MLSQTVTHSRSSLCGLWRNPSRSQIAYLHSTVSHIKQGPRATSSPIKDWSKNTVVELRAELKLRGLPVSGKKDELVARLDNATRVNFGTADASGATSTLSPSKTINSTEKLLPSIKRPIATTSTTPVKAPPVPKIPETYTAPTVAPILKLNTVSLTSSMANLRLASATVGPVSPITATLLNTSSFASLRASSTLTAPKRPTSPSMSPNTSDHNLRRQSVPASNSSPSTPLSHISSVQTKRTVSSVASASILASNKPSSPLKKPVFTGQPSAPTGLAQIHFAPSSPSNIHSTPIRLAHPAPNPQTANPTARTIHTSPSQNTMLSDNVHLPQNITPERNPIEIPNVPIIPTLQRTPQPIEIETPAVEQPIITAAGAHTHPAPPGKGAESTREHLQSDSTRPQSSGRRESELQDGRYEGDWASAAEDERYSEKYKFVPEEGDIPASQRGVLWGVVGAVALWGFFGPRNRKEK